MHNFRVYWISLYMFRSFRLSSGVQDCTYSVRYMSYRLVDCLLAGTRWKCKHFHVEWYSMNSKIMHLVGFTIEIYHDARYHERQIWILYEPSKAQRLLYIYVTCFDVNPLNPELNPICYLLAFLAHHFLHVSRIRVKSLTLRLLMSYIYIYIYIWSAYSWCF